ncbi:MAG: sensor histidine kinase [Blautia marasmi]
MTDYLELQKLRYGDIFDYRAEIEPELGKKKVLKLILQPIVENSLYHGIRREG